MKYSVYTVSNISVGTVECYLDDTHVGVTQPVWLFATYMAQHTRYEETQGEGGKL